MTTVLELAEALADAVTPLSPEFPVQVVPRYLFAPGDSCIDIYPATPAEANTSFGPGSRMHWFTIRLRVPTADADAAQDFLYAARNGTGDGSIREALTTSPALDALVDGIVLPDSTPSGFRLYDDSGFANGVARYLGEEWTVGLMVSDNGAPS